MGPKRKRPAPDADEGNRNSPHRPQELSLANESTPTNKRRSVRTKTETVAKPKSDALIIMMDFIYNIITDECIAHWGTANVPIKAKAIKHLGLEDEYEEYSVVFQEVIRSVLCERLDPSVGGTFVKEILEHDPDMLDAISPTRHCLDLFATFAEGGIPDVQRAKAFLMAAQLSPDMMREQFESKTLLELGLVRGNFEKSAVRYSTSVLYKQTTYNLLREDSEGYSKLVSEYYLAAERGAPTAEWVAEAFEKVKSLIGAFNIDSGRTLDVLLDVFGDMLIKRCRFFVRFLRASSFWPQPKLIEGLQCEDSGFGALPWWASPTFQDLCSRMTTRSV